MTVEDFMKQDNMEYSRRNTAGNVATLVTNLAKKSNDKNKIFLFLDEIEVTGSDDDLALLPTLVPKQGNLKVISCYRPSSEPLTFPASPGSLQVNLTASYRQSYELRVSLESLFKELFGYSILEGETSMLQRGLSTQQSLSWANFEKYDEEAVEVKLTQVKAGESRRCALINMTGSSSFTAWCKDHGKEHRQDISDY